MKKLITAVAIMIAGLSAAQTAKGNWMVSGKAGMNFNTANTKITAQGVSMDGPKVNTFKLEPSAAYFVANNLAAGIDLSFNSTKTTFSNQQLGINYDDTSSSFIFLPNLTYFFPAGTNIRPYIGAGVGLGSVTTSDIITNENTSAGGLAWGAKGGFVYFLNPSIGIDLGLQYNSLTVNRDTQNLTIKTTSGGFGANLGFSLFFGGNRVAN